MMCALVGVYVQSKVPLPARIIHVWDSAFVHVDYSAYGIPRLDEVVEASRLSRVVKFEPVAQRPADSASHSVHEGGNAAGSAPRSAPDDPAQQEVPSENASLKAFEEDFKKMRAGQALDQKQQELQRLQVYFSRAPPCARLPALYTVDVVGRNRVEIDRIDTGCAGAAGCSPAAEAGVAAGCSIDLCGRR